MPDVNGAMLTTNVLADQLAIDIGDRIMELEPNWQVLSVFSRAADKRRTTEPKFYGLESRSKARFDATTGTATTTITTIPVAHGSYFQQWDLVLNTRTGEVFRVDGVSANDLTPVQRGLQGTPGTGIAMNNADELQLIGNAQPEYDDIKASRNNIPTKIENYTQILREPFEISNTLRASAFAVGPAEWPRQAKEHLKEHTHDIETTLLHGRKSLTTPGSAADRTSGGILSFITSNQTDAGGDLSEAEFNAFLLQNARYGSSSKLLAASGVVTSALNKFPASKQQVRSDEKTYGMNVMHYASPFGLSLNVVYHKLLEGSKYGGYGILVDMDNVGYRYLANDELNRDTKLLPNRQSPGVDGTKSEYLTECGLSVSLQESHGVLTGVTS